VLYVNLTTTSYYWLLVTEDFLTGAPYNASNVPPEYDSQSYLDTESLAPTKIQSMQRHASNYSVLGLKDCLHTYSDIYVSTYSDVIMISSDRNDTNSLLAWDVSLSDSSSWLCAPVKNCEDIESMSGTDTMCDFKALEKDPSKWTSFGHLIRYCLARQVDLNCSLDFGHFSYGDNARLQCCDACDYDLYANWNVVND